MRRAWIGALAVAFSFVFTGMISLAETSSAKKQTGKKGSAKTSSTPWRLPSDVVPVSYELTFEPDIAKATFKGSEAIRLKFKKASKEIILNSDDLQIADAKLTVSNGNPGPEIIQVLLDKKLQRAKFVLKNQLPPGDYVFSCKFAGKLKDDLAGFYRCFYDDDAHKRHYLSATQMEPTDARKMFPCFDEPALKAVFNIKALVAQNESAISNGAIASEKKIGVKKLVSFEPTPPMSSYLVALLTGDWKRTGEKIVDGVKIAVWAPAGKEHLGKFSLEEAAKSFAYQNKYFSLPYPFKKMDLIAVPEFTMGGMENWGAITFSDDLLLVDEGTSSIFHKKSCSEVISHEIAHQWFGNLVTMKWWDDLWLNESFATWMESKVTEALHPEWETHFDRVHSRNGILAADGRKTTHPIHALVENPSQAMESFDGITYQKGSAILTMLEAFLGEEKFKEGVIKYLSAHKMGSASAEDLWSALGGAHTAEIMRGYLMQAGAPIVHVRKIKNPDSSTPNPEVLELTQYRFFETGRDKKDRSIWQIPMQVRDIKDAGSQPAVILLSNEKKLVPTYPDRVAFVNATGLGYYRTSYDHALLASIQEKFDNLTADEKIAFISDIQQLLLSGEIPVEDAYNLLMRIRAEKVYEVVAQMVYLLQSPYDYMKKDHKKEYQQFVQRLAIPLKDRINGWDTRLTDSQSQKELRLVLLRLLGTYGQDPETIRIARLKFEKYITERKSVNPDLVSTIFDIIAFNGKAADYQQLKRLWKTATNPKDKGRALFALADFHQKDLALQTIELARSSEVSKQDGLALLMAVASNEYTRDVGWPYLKQHWNELVKDYPRDEVTSLIYAGGPIEDRARQKEVMSWHAAHPVPHTTERKKRHDEHVETSLIYRERYAKRISDWVLKTGMKI
ncbi:MAG: M1 family metallopeptidase [Candidatus Obscuribacterales bacterium]|nr:M1 family metallopeptidase [Candidatus Obscuribacterales bacterium]